MSDDTISNALKMMPYGFYAFTTKSDDDANIMVVNWVSQMSYAPRLIAVGIQNFLPLIRGRLRRAGLRLEYLPAG